MAHENLSKAVCDLRGEWLAVVKALGLEELSPSEHRARVDRIESALGSVVMFAAQLRLAEHLGVAAEWRKFVNVAEIEGEE